MKFSKLVDKIEEAFDSHEQGHHVKSKDLSKLQRLLAEIAPARSSATGGLETNSLQEGGLSG